MIINTKRNSDHLIKSHPIFNFEIGDGCNLEKFKRNSFDIVHSNSVIEHVGNWDRIKNFSNEIKRVGKNYFLTTNQFFSYC